ncbi:prevent-host-death protein [Chromatiales bacterium (ex Bugula neritina AB1)]|nr:prevent-host-death protein [Chromatiales bacterium (ex Bugula neritina AB1)]
MKVYSYSEARQKLAELLDHAQSEEVLIKRKDGTVFSVKSKREKKSPFDVKGMQSKVTKENIVDAVRESREK